MTRRFKLTPAMVQRFDELLDDVLAELPAELTRHFDEIPLVVEDEPASEMLDKLGIKRPEFLRGLHTGVPLTRRSVHHNTRLPTVITIYRLGICLSATDSGSRLDEATLRSEIRRTVLHELGHHFGMNEDDLRRYGYG